MAKAVVQTRLGDHDFRTRNEPVDVTGYGDPSPRYVAGPTFYSVDGFPLSRDLFFALADYFGVLDKPAVPSAVEIVTALGVRGVILPEGD